MNTTSKAGLAALCISTLASCGGDSAAPKGSGAALQQAPLTQVAGKATVRDYMNADWLFSNYLEQYGVPAQTKPVFMPSLQLLANGFAVQLHRGEDVRKSVDQFHSTVTALAACDFQRKLWNGDNPLTPLPWTNEWGWSQSQIDLHTAMSAQSFSVPLTPDEQQAVSAARQRDAAEAAANAELIAAANLPYEIPGVSRQFVTFNQVMKKAGGGATTTSRSHPDVRLWRWSPGDVFWADGTAVDGAIGIGHVGLVDAYLEPSTIVDSNPANPNQGVDIWRDMNAWARRYTEVRQYSPTLQWDPVALRNAGNTFYPGVAATQSISRVSTVQYARNRLGLPYNYAFYDPFRTNSFYCSSLIWRSYYESGFNILKYWPAPGKIIFVQDVVIFGNVWMMNASKIG
jgi:hypothetical protein